MKILAGIAFVLTVIILGLIGGQKQKGARRFGIPGLSFLAASFNGLSWRNLPILLLIPTLVMGYGENSILMRWLHNDTLVRLVYALLLAVPFIFIGLKRFAVAFVILAVAFQIRAGVLFSIGTFQVLIEDIVRYATLGGLIFFNFVLKHD